MRRPGWEDRLADLIGSARLKPYRLGEHDCFRLACAVVEALTGRDLWSPWKGTYNSKREALRRIAAFGHDFSAAASKLFGVERSAMEFAHRGDVCEFADESGEQHLGVVMGAKVALLGPEGLKFLPRESCRHCWRID